MNNPATTAACSPLKELRNYLADLACEFRAARKFPELLEVETVKDIAEDDSKRLGLATDLIHAAENQDLKAAKMIEKVLEDGVVLPSEIPMLLNALALIKGSIVKDHKAADLVAC